jgi:hypothetical protein
MKAFLNKKFLFGIAALSFAMASSAQSNNFSYSGYSIGYMHTNRLSSSDSNGINFSGSFKMTENLFASANVLAQSDIYRGKVGLGVRAPVASNIDVYAIGGVARNTNFDKDWGAALTLGGKTMLAPKLELNLGGSYVNLNTNSTEKEIFASLGYALSKDLVIRTRSFRATGVQGYELSLGSQF